MAELADALEAKPRSRGLAAFLAVRPPSEVRLVVDVLRLARAGVGLPRADVRHLVATVLGVPPLKVLELEDQLGGLLGAAADEADPGRAAVSREHRVSLHEAVELLNVASSAPSHRSAMVSAAALVARTRGAELRLAVAALVGEGVAGLSRRDVVHAMVSSRGGSEADADKLWGASGNEECLLVALVSAPPSRILASVAVSLFSPVRAVQPQPAKEPWTFSTATAEPRWRGSRRQIHIGAAEQPSAWKCFDGRTRRSSRDPQIGALRELSAALEPGVGAVLDVVVEQDGRCVVVDVLWWCGESLVHRPFWDRRRLLSRVLAGAAGRWRLSTWSDYCSPASVRAAVRDPQSPLFGGAVVKALCGPASCYRWGLSTSTWLEVSPA